MSDHETCPECGGELISVSDGWEICTNCDYKQGLSQAVEKENVKGEEEHKNDGMSITVNKIIVKGKWNNIVKSTALFILLPILIWVASDISGQVFAFLLMLIPILGIISIIVGVFSGLCSKPGILYPAFISAFIGTLIVLLLISVVYTDADIDQEEGIVESNSGEAIARLITICLIMGFISEASAFFTNSILLSVYEEQNV